MTAGPANRSDAICRSLQPSWPAWRRIRVRSTIGAIALSVAIASALLGCSAHHTPDRGTVSGTFIATGGPVPVNGRPVQVLPLPGRVVAINGAGKHVQVTVGDSGKFRLSLLPGTYRLIGYNPGVVANMPGMQCGAIHPVHVRAGRVVSHVQVICSFP